MACYVWLTFFIQHTDGARQRCTKCTYKLPYCLTVADMVLLSGCATIADLATPPCRDGRHGGVNDRFSVSRLQ